jgi:ribosomal protein L35AE/L33A
LGVITEQLRSGVKQPNAMHSRNAEIVMCEFVTYKSRGDISPPSRGAMMRVHGNAPGAGSACVTRIDSPQIYNTDLQ